MLLGSVIVVSAAGVEFALREVRTSPAVQFHHAPPNLSVVVSAKNAPVKKRFSTNSAGIRGPELSLESAHRVLCVGGSTTQSHYLDDSETWTHLLMVELNDRLGKGAVWAGAAGVPGYTTVQHLRYVQTYPALTQYSDLVLLVGVNDLNYWLGSKAGRAQPRQAPVQPLWHRSATYQTTVSVFGRSFDPLENVLDAWSIDAAREQRASSRLVDSHPRTDRVLAGYRKRVSAIIDRCRELEIDPVFVAQPTLWDHDLPRSAEETLWMGRMRTENEYLSAARLRELMDEFNETLIDACRDRDVLVVDLSFMNGNPDYFIDDCHLTERGAEVVAHRIAEAMLAQLEALGRGVDAAIE
jgi:hypothetical protein